VLIRRARGVITVNSTVGCTDRAGCPTLALGEAIYRVAGLPFEALLDGSFRAGATGRGAGRCIPAPIAATLHVRGGYYAAAGLAAEGMATGCIISWSIPVTEVLLGSRRRLREVVRFGRNPIRPH
jgi:hypothetical protein